MDPKNLPSPPDTTEPLLKDSEVINPSNTTPQDTDVQHTETDSVPLPSRQPTKKFQYKEFSNEFCLPMLNFDSDTSDDLPYSTHTTIEHSSILDENHEEDIKCCNNLHKRYHTLYNCNLEEISNPLENSLKSINIKPQARKEDKLDRLDEILAKQMCINEKSEEDYCELREDLDVPKTHGDWRRNLLDIEKEQNNIVETSTNTSEQYEDDLEEDNISDFEEAEIDENYLEEQEALLNSYKDQLRNKREVEQNSHTFYERPPSRRGERPPGRRGERPCDIKIERPSSAGKQESNSCHNRYRMLNTPMRIGSAMTSQSCNNSNSQSQLFRKNSDIVCSTYYKKKTETSEYCSTLNTVQKFFETRLDITNNINSKYCTRKPTSVTSMSDNLPMHYTIEEMQYLGQEPETCDDISYPSTSLSNTIVEESFPNKLPEENKPEDDF